MIVDDEVEDEDCVCETDVVSVCCCDSVGVMSDEIVNEGLAVVQLDPE